MGSTVTCVTGSVYVVEDVSGGADTQSVLSVKRDGSDKDLIVSIIQTDTFGSSAALSVPITWSQWDELKDGIEKIRANAEEQR